MSWRSSSQQAADCGRQRPPSLAKVLLQSESYFATRCGRADSPSYHLCQIHSVRGAPRASHPYTSWLGLCTPMGKQKGAAFLSHPSPAVRLCSQDATSYIGGGCGRQEKSQGALTKLHGSSRAGRTDLPAEEEDETECIQGAETYGSVFV